MKLYRQGDVLLKQVAVLPKEKMKKKDTVLAYGEATGHMHMFPAIADVSTWLVNGQTFVEVFRPTMLTHQEHKHLQIEKGTYEVIIEREYDYFQAELRKVVD